MNNYFRKNYKINDNKIIIRNMAAQRMFVTFCAVTSP